MRDTLVQDEPAAAKPKPDAEPAAPKVPAILDAPSPDAAEIGRIIMESGITKDQLNSLLEAPRALEALRSQIINDPKEFIRTLERTAPEAGQHFLDETADLFLERNKHKIEPEGKDKDGKPATDPATARELATLKEAIAGLTAKDRQRETAAMLASVRQRYDARVDDMLNLKEVKEMGLAPSEVKNLRARLFQELSSDTAATQRVNNGNFVDVPKVFQSLLAEKVADRVTATDAEKKERERVASGSFLDFPNGPDAAFLSEVEKAIAGDTDPNWGGTVDGFAKALERTAR